MVKLDAKSGAIGFDASLPRSSISRRVLCDLAFQS
jgi:hypothetical protein